MSIMLSDHITQYGTPIITGRSRIAVGYVLIEHIDERLVLLVELGSVADCVYERFYLLGIAVEHLYHAVDIERGKAVHEAFKVSKHILHAIDAHGNILKAKRTNG